MNRLIIIGNGFDLAHGLKTKYSDYILNYWQSVKSSRHKDIFFEFNIEGIDLTNCNSYKDIIKTFEVNGHKRIKSERKLYSLFTSDFTSSDNSIISVFNYFFLRLNEVHSELNWVDIEMEYYNILKSTLKDVSNLYYSDSNKKEHIKFLNDNIASITSNFELYLKNHVLEKSSEIKIKELENILSNDVQTQSQISIYLEEFPKKLFPKLKGFYQYIESSQLDLRKFNNTHILNFNYTNTIHKYFNKIINDNVVINNIHGKIGDKNNEIKLGFGDEKDDFYKIIENENKNEYLRFMKSFFYSNTNNYKRLFDFLEESEFQIEIMGHSCGLSDRTLLNALFEHPNCLSIKVYYHKYQTQDEDGNEDNYSDIVKNISRHFNQKTMMRNKIVDKTLCKPLPQIY
jgi:hypothetical protein